MTCVLFHLHDYGNNRDNHNIINKLHHSRLDFIMIPLHVLYNICLIYLHI